jgi:tRNA 2-thiocytidine biosynthesis protein TtcA
LPKPITERRADFKAIFRGCRGPTGRRQRTCHSQAFGIFRLRPCSAALDELQSQTLLITSGNSDRRGQGEKRKRRRLGGKQEKKKNTKLFLHLKKWLEKAVLDYGMIAAGDKVLVGVSGGADSYALLDLLDSPMVFVPEFTFLAVNIDMGFDSDYVAYREMEKYFQAHQYPYVMEKTDIGVLAHSEFNRKNPCFLCSRLRRKRIFEIADAHGCNKIAFAHHRDDIIETLLINLFYGREISTMLPNQSIFGGKLHIIRPLPTCRKAS